MSAPTGWLEVTVKAQQRMSMGRGAGKAFHTEGHAHVPGSVLRGAIARAWLVDGAGTDSTFRDVFDRCLRFGPMFAEGTDLRPLSERHCKYAQNPTHVCAPVQEGEAPPRTYWDAAFDPPGDGTLPSGWDSAAGHWTTSKGDVVAAPGAQLPTTTVTSTAIDHRVGTAAKSQLFSRGAVETGTILRGLIAGHPEILDVLAKALAEQDQLELGGRSSVLGSARITAVMGVPPPPPEGDLVVLRMLSPTFLLDPAGRPSLDKTGLEAELRRLGFAGTVERVWLRPITDGTGGFHAASRLPKPADTGLAAGTTAVLRPADGDTSVLAALAKRGLGVRRPEGFGWVSYAHTPWTEPVPLTHPSGLATLDESAYTDLRRSLREARLNTTQLTWLSQRLVEGTGQDEDAALKQPVARGLTTGQRAAVRASLSAPGTLRRRLADRLREERPR
jgi:CRISPR-associated protein Csx10